MTKPFDLNDINKSSFIVSKTKYGNGEPNH